MRVCIFFFDVLIWLYSLVLAKCLITFNLSEVSEMLVRERNLQYDCH